MFQCLGGNLWLQKVKGDVAAAHLDSGRAPFGHILESIPLNMAWHGSSCNENANQCSIFVWPTILVEVPL